jgi:hypothetical protein
MAESVRRRQVRGVSSSRSSRKKPPKEPEICDMCKQPIVDERPFKVVGMKKLGISKTCQRCADKFVTELMGR